MGMTWQICCFFLVFEKFRIETVTSRQIFFLSVSLANICKGLKKNYSVLNRWITSSELCLNLPLMVVVVAMLQVVLVIVVCAPVCMCVPFALLFKYEMDTIRGMFKMAYK